MKSNASRSSSAHFLLARLVPLLGVSLAVPSTLVAQTQPPIGGATGTIALDGTVQKEHAAANTIVVKTADGVEHLFHFTKDLVVHGKKGGGAEALQGLRNGSTVAVHYTVVGNDAAALEIDQIGDEGLASTEGTVVGINRARRQITIRFESGKTETFELTERAVSGVGKDIDSAPVGTVRVTVYYTDDGGRRVAHFFKKSS